MIHHEQLSACDDEITGGAGAAGSEAIKKQNTGSGADADNILVISDAQGFGAALTARGVDALATANSTFKGFGVNVFNNNGTQIDRLWAGAWSRGWYRTAVQIGTLSNTSLANLDHLSANTFD